MLGAISGGLSAKLCLHVFHVNIFIPLFSDTASISGFVAASGWMIKIKMNKKCRDCNGCGMINPLKTKRRPLYLKTQSVPRCKHFSPGV